MAQGFSIEKRSIKIEREFVNPAINLAQRTYRPLTKPTVPTKWLQFLVTYKPVSAKKKSPVWEDDLNVELMVLLPAKQGENYGNVIMLTGHQVLFSVQGDDKAHYVLFAIPPAILRKYTSFTKYDTKEAESVFAAVVFRKKTSQLLATGYGVVKGKSSGDIAKLFERYHKSRGVMKLENGLLPKEKTPWQWVDIDLFDAPKSMMEGNK